MSTNTTQIVTSFQENRLDPGRVADTFNHRILEAEVDEFLSSRLARENCFKERKGGRRKKLTGLHGFASGQIPKNHR